MEDNKFEKMADLHDEIISDDKIDIINNLCERWHGLGIGLWEDEFDAEEFKSLLRDTIPVLYDFAFGVMPIEFVGLLLEIKQFQQSPQIDDDSGVAIHIARYLCDTSCYCNVDEEENEENNETRLLVEVWGNTAPHKLYVDALDFTELASDIDL